MQYTSMEQHKEILIRTFLYEEPYTLKYEYRKQYSTYTEDKPALDELIKEGRIKQTYSDRRIVVFVFIK